jgi:antitoxin (DNA-binding transcriptional repressor) of toxin-antitoxin stability system
LEIALMKATTLDLRRRMSEVVRALQRGQQVTLTHRGKVIGTIHPTSNGNGAKTSIRDHPAFGMWADREDMKDPAAWVRKLRSKRRNRWRALRLKPLPGKRNRAV